MSQTSAPRWVHASAEADAAVQARLEAVLGALRKLAGDDIIALVVGGSLARAEGAVLATSAGLGLLSDIDLFVVVEPRLHRSSRDLDAAARRALAGDPFLLAPLDLGVIDCDWFGRMGPTLPAFQLAARYTVFWERDERWQRPVAPPGPVSVDDAVRLLHNRFAEALLYRARAARTPPDPFALFHRWKVWYDAPLAWLAAIGRYHPDRAVQDQGLEEVAARLPGGAAEWLRQGGRRAAELRAAVRAAPLGEDQLANMGFSGAAESSEQLRRWVWPLWRAALAHSSAGAPQEPAAVLARAFQAGAPYAGDLALAQRWLRRGSAMGRLRQARRWAPLSPRPLTPWWRHAPGGTGPDRMYAAAALRFGGVAEWDRPLRGLVRGFAGDWARTTGGEGDTWLGQLWSGWMMGGARR